MDIVVGQPYAEPTQWVVDVLIGGVKTQLTFGPADRVAPTQAEIDAAIEVLLSPGIVGSNVIDRPDLADAVITPGAFNGR